MGRLTVVEGFKLCDGAKNRLDSLRHQVTKKTKGMIFFKDIYEILDNIGTGTAVANLATLWWTPPSPQFVITIIPQRLV
jgi:hypothetical protein